MDEQPVIIKHPCINLTGNAMLTFMFFCCRMDRYNRAVISNEEISDKIGKGSYTVSAARKELRNAGLAKTRTGEVMVNPKFAVHPGADEAEIKRRYDTW